VTTSTYRRDRTTPRVVAGRLWAGGAATAIVAALIVVVGISLCRGVFGVPVPVPTYSGGVSEVAYVLLAAGAAVLATALLHLLLVTAPRPLAFFGWIVFLATVVAVLAPFTNSILGSAGHVALLNSKLATAAINLAAGIAIGTLLTGVARSAVTRNRPDPYPTYPMGG
jgi:Family of unknown function (DUF6069)